ncbi:uncharacterized protein LOC134727597 [Mytilus trossulus]|uniref:uncharacterized protein LOC134727597 n=1 Tax=Mytilus trossulus TaxID=6551 RepID=UPI0030078A7E
MNIEKKLNILETKIVKDINSIHSQQKTGIVDTVRKLQQKREALNRTLIDFENLQKNASDFHIYMVMKKLETDLSEEGKEINSLLLQEEIKLKRLSFSPNADFLSTVSKTVSLGNIAVRTNQFSVLNEINTNAQSSLTVSTKRITSVHPKMRLSGYNVYEGDDINISSIIVLPDRKILLADFGEDGGILLFGESGHFITKMKQFGKPYGTALIDDFRMAVSFPNNGNIKILKLGPRISLIYTLQMDVDLNAISFYDKHIIVCSRPQSVLFVDLNGAIAKRLDLGLPSARITFIHCLNNKMLISEFLSDTIYCFDFYGNEIWNKHFETGQDTRNVCADKFGNVYCVGMNSGTLVCLSKDGQKIQDLTSFRNNLVMPKAIYYDERSRTLLIASQQMQSAAVFDLVTV